MEMKLDYDIIEASEDTIPYLVFIHGAGGDKTQWKKQFQYFNKLGWGILIPSLPGHGSSRIIEKINITYYTEIFSKLIVHLKIKEIIIIGHSMGGAIALEYAIQNAYPSLKKLILIGTGARLKVAPIFFELIESDFNEALQLMAKYAYYESSDIKVKSENEEILRRNGKEILLQDFKACNDFDIRTKIRNISCPTLIICGENDIMTPVKFSSYLHQKIPESQLVIFPEAGHFVFQEKPNEVNEQIHAFIQCNK
jgi:pimeloyl-ACP methyl ester carboxylesterase